jgi:tetratricopeptide (TPR) repeat protein
MFPTVRNVFFLALSLMISLSPEDVLSQVQDPWIGALVVVKQATALRVGDSVVDECKYFSIYIVEQTNGPWLWVVSRGVSGGVSGWLKTTDVVRFEDAVDYFTRVIKSDSSSDFAFVMQGSIWDAKGEYDVAIADCNDAIRPEPRTAAHFNNRGHARNAQGEYDKAIADFNEAIRLDPSYDSAYNNRGVARSALKQYEKAVADFTEVLRLKTQDSLAYNNRGEIYNYLKQYDRALSDHLEATRLNPADPGSYAGRAWIMCTFPDPKYRDGRKAVELARKACEMVKPEDGYFFNVLAAALAETRDFGGAVEWQEKALKTHTQDVGPTRQDYEARLALYKQRKPYRQPE